MRKRKELIGVFSGFPDHHFSEEITKRLREEHARRRSIVFITARPTDYAQNDDDCDGMHEMFAQEKGLKFLHCDIPLAEDDIEIAHERDFITLRFHENGRADIHYNCFTPGSSAGSYGGGEYVRELPKDFYVGCTVEQFAGNFPERLHEQLTANEMLRRFLDAANSR